MKNTLADNLTCVLVVRLNFAALIESIGILSDRKGAYGGFVSSVTSFRAVLPVGL